MHDYASLIIGALSGLLAFVAITVRMNRRTRAKRLVVQPSLPFEPETRIRSRDEELVAR
jgi:hypothetical protein